MTLTLRRYLRVPRLTLEGASTARGFPLSGSVADYDFRNNRYFGPDGSVANASGGYVDDKAGNWALVPPNTLRRSDKGALIEGAQTNSIRNNSMQGAVAGTPGTLPTNWSFGGGSAAGLTYSVVGVGVENGVDYIEMRFFGTPTSTAFQLWLENSGIVTAASGALYSLSTFARMSGGTAVNVAGYAVGVSDVGGTGSSEVTIALSGLFFQRPTSASTTAGSTTSVRPYARLKFSNTATPVDFTIRIGWPQLEQWNAAAPAAGSASSPIRTTSAVATRSADAVSVTLPAGTTRIVYTFDDDSTQQASVPSGAYIIPTNLNRPYIARLTAYAS